MSTYTIHDVPGNRGLAVTSRAGRHHVAANFITAGDERTAEAAGLKYVAAARVILASLHAEFSRQPQAVRVRDLERQRAALADQLASVTASVATLEAQKATMARTGDGRLVDLIETLQAQRGQHAAIQEALDAVSNELRAAEEAIAPLARQHAAEIKSRFMAESKSDFEAAVEELAALASPALVKIVDAHRRRQYVMALLESYAGVLDEPPAPEAPPTTEAA